MSIIYNYWMKGDKEASMNILITGARGFVGRNLTATLENIRAGKDATQPLDADIHILPYDLDTAPELLDTYCAQADFVVHLAGVNRPKDAREFMEGNFGFTTALLDTLKKHDSKAPVLITSSIQAELDNPYGQSKKAGEDCLLAYGKSEGVPVFVYRLPNVFGKWCRPNYNSAIATFCHNIARNLPIVVSDRANPMSLVYIDDVVEEILRAMAGQANRQGDYYAVPMVYQTTLGFIVDTIYAFRQSRQDLSVPDVGDPLVRKLYATYLSYLPEDGFCYPLNMKTDDRGSFTEFVRTPDRGQFSVNISKPRIVKGNHWHHTKNEKFLVVSGTGVIRLRKIDGDKVLEYFVSGDKLEVVDIPTGYTHNIENLGDTDMVTLMWASEPFDPRKPETYFLEV